jgi:hypothetical protein
VKKALEPQPGYIVVWREDFIEARMVRYIAKKRFLEKMEKQTGEKWFHITDLDKTYPPFTKPMREVVICDGCNEDIEDEEFVFLERQLCYHKKCAIGREWYRRKPDKNLAVETEVVESAALPDNVIPFRKETKS